jgi:hypothetical protein
MTGYMWWNGLYGIALWIFYFFMLKMWIECGLVWIGLDWFGLVWIGVDSSVRSPVWDKGILKCCVVCVEKVS